VAGIFLVIDSVFPGRDTCHAGALFFSPAAPVLDEPMNFFNQTDYFYKARLKSLTRGTPF
jgi:hypothetical protein